MSWHAQAWAAEQRTGSASAKLVLLGLASLADANHCAFPSVAWLCGFSDLNRKTVILALARLETEEVGLICDTGRRVGRTKQVKVYQLCVDQAMRERRLAADPAALEAMPKTERFQKRNSSVLPSKQSRKRDTEPVKNQESSPNPDGLAPRRSEKLKSVGVGAGLSPLARDWAPPATSALSVITRDLVEQWPRGAFEAACEAFRQHWVSNSRLARKKSDWNAELGKWLIGDHSRVMRASKAGVKFISDAAAQTESGLAGKTQPQPSASKRLEDNRSADLHSALRGALGNAITDQWFAPVALVFDDASVHVIAPSRFHQSWLEERHLSTIRTVLGALGWPILAVRFSFDPPGRSSGGAA